MKTKIELGVYIYPHKDHETWIYQDIKQYPNVDIVCDVKSLPMIESESMDEVYASHIIEHFYFADVKDVLMEWVRILKKGGKMEIVFPDFMLLWEFLIDKSKIKWYPKGMTIEDFVCKLMINDRQLPDLHQNHYPHYWYKTTLEELGCSVEVKRVCECHIPEVHIYAVKT